jgi:cytochrome bd-type quinol oxidase subunit 1
MGNNEILDQNVRRERTPEEESQFHLLKLDAANVKYHIRNARVALFVLAAMWGVFAIGAFLGRGETLLDDSFFYAIAATNGVLAIIFATLGWFARRNPVVIFGIALGLYALLAISDMINSFSILGALIKLLVLFMLFEGLRAGTKLKSIRQQAQTLGATEEEIFEE